MPWPLTNAIDNDLLGTVLLAAYLALMWVGAAALFTFVLVRVTRPDPGR